VLAGVVLFFASVVVGHRSEPSGQQLIAPSGARHGRRRPVRLAKRAHGELRWLLLVGVALLLVGLGVASQHIVRGDNDCGSVVFGSANHDACGRFPRSHAVPAAFTMAVGLVAIGGSLQHATHREQRLASAATSLYVLSVIEFGLVFGPFRVGGMSSDDGRLLTGRGRTSRQGARATLLDDPRSQMRAHSSWAPRRTGRSRRDFGSGGRRFDPSLASKKSLIRSLQSCQGVSRRCP
jgi:hypothetical protein